MGGSGLRRDGDADGQDKGDRPVCKGPRPDLRPALTCEAAPWSLWQADSRAPVGELGASPGPNQPLSIGCNLPGAASPFLPPISAPPFLDAVLVAAIAPARPPPRSTVACSINTDSICEIPPGPCQIRALHTAFLFPFHHLSSGSDRRSRSSHI